MSNNKEEHISSRKVAVVTGASSGIGAAIAARLAPTMTVVLVARRAHALEEVADRIGHQAGVYAADLTDKEAVIGLAKNISETYGAIDALVNCAGARPDRVLTSMDFESVTNLWDAQVALNLNAAAYVTFALAPLLRRPGGRIVNIGSIAAVTGGRRPGSSAYAAAKAGTHGLTLGLSRELAGEGVSVNTISPGFVAETEFTGGWGPEITGPLVAETPAGRAGTVDDIANAVDFLLSGESGFITGQNLAINGGMR